MFLSLCLTEPLTAFNPCLFPTAQEEELSEYELERRANMARNEEQLALLDKVKIGKVVCIPADVFPDDEAPPDGYWLGKVVKTAKGGASDVGILIEGEEIFTRPRSEVAGWIREE